MWLQVAFSVKVFEGDLNPEFMKEGMNNGVAGCCQCQIV